MPIKKSAKKHLRASARKKTFNNARKEAIKKGTKKTILLISEEKKEEAKKAFQQVQKALDKAVKKGTISKNTAARKKSRLIKKIKAI